MKKPIISTRKKNFTTGGVVLGYDWPEYLMYVYKTLFARPKVDIDFSLETGATSFSLPYFLLTIKSEHKEIGNIDVRLTGNFYDIHKQKKITLPFLFQDLPEIIESAETVILECKPEIDFRAYLHPSSNIKLTVDYGYMFLGQVHSVTYSSIWGFNLNLKNEMNPALILLSSKKTQC